MKLKDFDFRVWYGEKYLKQKYSKGRFGYCERGYAVGFVGDRHKLVYEIIQGIDSNEYGDNDYEWIYDLDLDENDCEVELWTGLYDKNNKKIYEGDILYSFEDCPEDENFIYVVKFKNGAFYLVEPEDMDSVGEQGDVIYYPEEFEVVGNIHENLELLEPKDSKWK